MTYPSSWRITPRLRSAIKAPAGVPWYEITNKTATRAEILLFGDIGWDGITAAQFVSDLNAITAPAVDLRISSGGGEVHDAVAIHAAIERHPAHVTAYVDGLAASAASFILQAADERVMGRNSQAMVHDALSVCVGNEQEMRETAAMLGKTSDVIASIYARRSGQGTVKSWRAVMREERWYDAAEAVAAGLADRVADDSGRVLAATIKRGVRAAIDGHDPKHSEWADMFRRSMRAGARSA